MVKQDQEVRHALVRTLKFSKKGVGSNKPNTSEPSGFLNQTGWRKRKEGKPRAFRSRKIRCKLRGLISWAGTAPATPINPCVGVSVTDICWGQRVVRSGGSDAQNQAQKKKLHATTIPLELNSSAKKFGLRNRPGPPLSIGNGKGRKSPGGEGKRRELISQPTRRRDR